MRRAALACLFLLHGVQAAPAAEAPQSPQPGQAPGLTNPFAESEQRPQGVAFELLGTRDSSDFRSTRLHGGLLVREESPFDFLAVGGGVTRYEQDDWSTERYTLGAAVRKVERATGAGLVATAGLSQVGDSTRAILEATWNRRLSQRTGFELIGQRDFVETRAGLEAGTMTNFAAASVDHVVAERLTLIGLGGLQYFSDDNRRWHLRGRAIYPLLPEQGVSMLVRAKVYESSRPGGSLYFNPENYQQGDLGLRLRRSIGGHWRVLAAAGVGGEEIDHSEGKRTYYVEARAERSFANNLWLMLTYVLDHSSASDNSTGQDYKWQYFRAVAVIPF